MLARKLLRGVFFSLTLLVLTGVVAAEGQKEAPAPVQGEEEVEAATYVWASGGLGGGWYTAAGGLARLINENEPKLSVKVIPGGGASNPVLISEKKADIGWGVSPVDKMAYTGNPALFKQEYPNIRGLYGNWTRGFVHFIVAEKVASRLNIETFQDFVDLVKAGNKFDIAVSQIGTSDFIIIGDILKFYGISFEAIESAGGKVVQAIYRDQATLFKDRQVDLVFTYLSPGAAAVTEMAISRPLVLLPTSKACLEYMQENIGMVKGDTYLPGGLYPGVDDEVMVPSGSSEITLYKDLPDIVAYTIAKIFAENIEQVRMIRSDYKNWDPEESCKGTVVPLHPGAEKYFKERGWLD